MQYWKERRKEKYYVEQSLRYIEENLLKLDFVSGNAKQHRLFSYFEEFAVICFIYDHLHEQWFTSPSASNN